MAQERMAETGPSAEQLRPPSEFEQSIALIARYEQEPESPERNQLLLELKEGRERLLKEANEMGLFDGIKESLVETYYNSRVKVSHSDKVERRRVTGEAGVLIELSQLQREAQLSLEDNTRIWSNPRISQWEQRYRGVVDYFNRETLNTIVTLVKDRKASLSPNYKYRDSGLFRLWEGLTLKGEGGLILRDDYEIPWRIENFDDIREAIEEERRRDPYVPTRNYESWVEFVADDAEELEEMIPYIARKVKKIMIKGEPNATMQTLDQEKQKLVRALAIFPTESARQLRRLKSSMVAEINTMAAYELAEEVRIDPQAYFHFMESVARAFRQTEDQDHFVDSMLLDRDGFTMLALEGYSANDGEIWRYGPNTRDTNRLLDGNHNMGALFDRQQEARRRIEENLMNRKLKKMSVLLGLEPDRNGNTTIHPAFQRLKDKLTPPDWQEYCEKALLWGQEGKFDDPKKRPRVIFQHPLARALTKDEFEDMFEADQRTDRLYRSAKRRRVRQIMEKSERIIRAFQFDVTAGGPRHTFRNSGEPEQLGTLIDEVPPYVPIADVNEISPHPSLMRDILQAAIEQDRGKSLDQRRFKIYHLLKEKVGLDIDSPLFAGWYAGAHDTNRPVLLKYAYGIDKFKDILDRNAARRAGVVKLVDGRDDPTAADEKTTMARWAEREAEFILAVEYVVRKKFGRYFNFPGHDTDDGGVKDFRNANLPAYGISRETVEANGLIAELISSAGDFGKDWGCTVSPWRQLVGLFKGPDEVVFRETGYNGFIENPRDAESWVRRSNSNFNLFQLYTRGSKDQPGSHGLLNDGPISGAYRTRAIDIDSQNYPGNQDKLFAINNPEEAYKIMYESTYERYVDTAAKVMAPLMTVMHENLSSQDSTYGRNPGFAMFKNTMLMYSVFAWMDTNWTEYRGKFGYSFNADLYLARKFMHTVLYESRLVLSDKEFDERMVGYTRVEVDIDGKPTPINVIRYEVDGQGNTVASDDIKIGDRVLVKKGDVIQGEIHEGILDSFPPDLRKEIIKKKWLPFGLNSEYPETLEILSQENIANDNPSVAVDYAQAIKKIKTRKEIKRP